MRRCRFSQARSSSTELAKEAALQGLPTLELACGSGRIAVPLAREGVRLVGLDNSSAMLVRARESPCGEF